MSEGIPILVIEGISPSGNTVTTRMQKILKINGVDWDQLISGGKVQPELEERMSALEAEYTSLALANDSLYQMYQELADKVNPPPDPSQPTDQETQEIKHGD